MLLKKKKTINNQIQFFLVCLGWLQSYQSDETKAYCKYCNDVLFAHKKSLIKHSSTEKHKRNSEAQNVINQTPSISSKFPRNISERRKVAELKIAAMIAEHCSVRTVDHLGEIIKELDDKSELLQSIKLHRTKCIGLINNVLSPCMLEDLICDIGQSYYSMIIDESTTIDTKKVGNEFIVLLLNTSRTTH